MPNRSERWLEFSTMQLNCWVWRALERCSIVMDTKNSGDHGWVSITDRCHMVRLRPSKSNR